VDVRVKIDTIGRRVWKNAKDKFTKTWVRTTNEQDQYWEDFGTEHNMRVIIERYEHAFPVINEVEFTDEKSYIWFMMRWL
jgi:hypothetical protein